MIICGNCGDTSTNLVCNGRHQLYKFDPIGRGCLEAGTKITIEIVRVFTPVNFSVRILSHCANEENQHWLPYTQFPRTYFEAQYADADTTAKFNRGVRIGYYGMVQYEGRPERCQLLENRYNNIKVQLIDRGKMAYFKLDDMQFLHERYQKYFPDIQTLFIGGIVFGQDDETRTLVEDWLKFPEDGADGIRIECEVLVHLRSALVVADMRVFDGNRLIKSLKEHLISLGLVVENADGVEWLKKLKAEFGKFRSVISIKFGMI